MPRTKRPRGPRPLTNPPGAGDARAGRLVLRDPVLRGVRIRGKPPVLRVDDEGCLLRDAGLVGPEPVVRARVAFPRLAAVLFGARLEGLVELVGHFLIRQFGL